MAHLPEDLQASLRWSSIVHRRVRGFLVPKLPLLCVSSPFLRTIQCSFAPHARISNAYQASTMELSHQAQPPTRQAASTAPAQAASGQNGQNPRKRSLSATDVEQCDAKGSSSGRRARRDELQQDQSCDTHDSDAFAPPIGHGAPKLNGTTAAETFADGLDGGAKGAAAATKKVSLEPTPGATPETAAPALEAPEWWDQGGSPDNYCARRGKDSIRV